MFRSCAYYDHINNVICSFSPEYRRIYVTTSYDRNRLRVTSRQSPGNQHGLRILVYLFRSMRLPLLDQDICRGQGLTREMACSHKHAGRSRTMSFQPVLGVGFHHSSLKRDRSRSTCSSASKNISENRPRSSKTVRRRSRIGRFVLRCFCV